MVELPSCLSSLLSEKFFNACLIHEDQRKNEKNVYCLDCCEGICPHCFVNHSSHRLLQVRRYVYHDVIRLADADKLMDCSLVQSYTTNSAKVVFLNQRPQTRPPRSSGNLCITCDRNLQESFLFCCLSCKIQCLVKNGSKVSMHLPRNCEFPPLRELDLEEGQMTPDSVLEQTESGSSGGLIEMMCTETTSEVVKKKRSSLPVPGCRRGEAVMNRRKGTPQRSPLV